MSDGKPSEPREPTLTDLIDLCREFNRRGALYIVIGGIAMVEHGLPRFTEDLDILYETSLANQQKIRAALALLPGKAILEIGDDENMAEIGTIRVNDVITVDLMPSACGVDFHQTRERVMTREHGGVSIPYATLNYCSKPSARGARKIRSMPLSCARN